MNRAFWITIVAVIFFLVFLPMICGPTAKIF
jgi:hypothetical protein